MNKAIDSKKEWEANEYIKPKKTWKCRLGLHAWGPVHQSKGASICYHCNLLDDGYVKRVARVKKNGSVL